MQPCTIKNEETVDALAKAMLMQTLGDSRVPIQETYQAKLPTLCPFKFDNTLHLSA